MHYQQFNKLQNVLGIQLHYTAPYYPFLNPAENYFTIIKNSFVRRAIPNTEEELRLSIAESVESIGQAKSQKIFNYCIFRIEIEALTTR